MNLRHQSERRLSCLSWWSSLVFSICTLMFDFAFLLLLFFNESDQAKNVHHRKRTPNGCVEQWSLKQRWKKEKTRNLFNPFDFFQDKEENLNNECWPDELRPKPTKYSIKIILYWNIVQFQCHLDRNVRWKLHVYRKDELDQRSWEWPVTISFDLFLSLWFFPCSGELKLISHLSSSCWSFWSQMVQYWVCWWMLIILMTSNTGSPSGFSFLVLCWLFWGSLIFSSNKGVREKVPRVPSQLHRSILFENILQLIENEQNEKLTNEKSFLLDHFVSLIWIIPRKFFENLSNWTSSFINQWNFRFDFSLHQRLNRFFDRIELIVGDFSRWFEHRNVHVRHLLTKNLVQISLEDEQMPFNED